MRPRSLIPVLVFVIGLALAPPALAGRTVSDIKLLNDEQRVTELARMLGGQTDPARKHAKAMLGIVS